MLHKYLVWRGFSKKPKLHIHTDHKNLKTSIIFIVELLAVKHSI